MSELKEYIKQASKMQQYSSQAKRLQEKLLLIKDRINPSRRRWFWELLQNASDYNEHVSVRLIVTQDKVEFLHDGAPFSVTDVLNVISPDSGKDDEKDESNKENIGKFGTGLVSTHILSSLMQVKGIFCKKDDNSLFEFAFTLDRSCFEDKTELIDEMAKVRTDFEVSEHKEVSKCEGFNTSFTYILNHPLPKVPAMMAADIDLDYLYAMLPYTLCFMDKVESIFIEDRRNDVHTYSIRRKEKTEGNIVFEITCDGIVSTKNFAVFSFQDVSTTFCYENNTIVPFPKNISKMFCGLPLIGMEEIGMPFILNSLKFIPSSERDGIAFSPSSNPENRKLLVDSVKLYSKMLDYIEAKRMDGAYNLTHMSRKYNGNQESNEQFQKVGILHYKQELLNHSIVRSQSGDFINYAQVRIPFNDSKLDEKLYDLASSVAEKVLPAAADYKHWFEATDFSLFSEQEYTYKMLAEKIEQVGSVLAFGKSADITNNWLKKCIVYLKDCNRYIFSEKKLLPNQLGELRLCNELFVDNDLPNELKNIYNMLFDGDGSKIEAELLDKTYEQLEVVNQTCSVEHLSRRIDDKVADVYNKNNSNASSIALPLNKLYTWMANSKYTKEQLQSWYKWYFPKRAGLVVDMLTETQREQALVIAQSGKMEALASLASSDLTDEEFALLVTNIKKLPSALSYLMSNVDDKSFADSKEGDYGEEIVRNELLRRYPRREGYKVVWASKDFQEARYDFVVKKGEEIVCYCDAKTTKRGIANADSIPFFMRRSQWEFLQTMDKDTPYYIARVFLGDNNAVKIMRISVPITP